MSLNRIQKTFIRLAINQQGRWPIISKRKIKRFNFKKWQPTQVKVEIINAVTGEKTTAKAYEVTAAKLKKWLKLRNMRAEFTDVLLKKHSTWATFKEEEFED